MRYLDPERDFAHKDRCEWPGCWNDAEVHDTEADTAYCEHHA